MREILEYNARFPSDCEWIMPHKAYHVWDRTDKHGASLKSLELLGRKKGYTLVGTNINGINAFFVRNDLDKDLFPTPATSENLYNCGRGVILGSGHTNVRCLADDEDNQNEHYGFSDYKKKILKENIRSRKILIWGLGIGFRILTNILESQNITDYITFDSNRNNYNDLNLINKDDYFVIVACRNYYPEIVTDLENRNFSENIDYLYFFK